MKNILLSLFIMISLVGCKIENQKNLELKKSQVFGGKEISENLSLKQHIVGVENFKTGGVCTGTIIKKNIILTAAHCVPKNANAGEIKIIFDHDFYTSEKNKIAAEKIIIHENYQLDKTIVNDVALIKMKKDIPENYAELNIERVQSIQPSEVKNVTVSGFGFSRVEFPRWGLGTLRFTDVPILIYVDYSPLVLLDQTKGSGICQGDSGGGAFVQMNEEWIQIGVTSFVNTKENNPKKADCKRTSGFSSTLYFLPWIQENILKFE